MPMEKDGSRSSQKNVSATLEDHKALDDFFKDYIHRWEITTMFINLSAIVGHMLGE